MNAYLCAGQLSSQPVVYPNRFQDSVTLLPESTPFFPTMLAHPHIIGYSVGYRTHDKVFKRSCIPVSIGDQFSLYRFRNICQGDLYFGIEACVWGIFEARKESLSLVNADYFVGLPLTYIHDRFSAKLRIFHESSHLGDEFILEHPEVKRLNPSMEVIDFAIAYDLLPSLTVFGGYSKVLRSDKSYKVRPNNFYYGFNYYFDALQAHICNIKATPYFAAFFTQHQNHNWKIDTSLALGYEWDSSFCHKLRLYLEGHNGFSEEGQFSKQRTKYLQIKLLYGY
jgi:hypothetical protein